VPVPAGTVTVNEVAEALVTGVLIPPTYTIFSDARLLNPFPLMVREVPNGPLAGENDVRLMDDPKRKPMRSSVPNEFVTATLPVAPPPIVAVILISLFTVNELADTPPKLTAVVPVKLTPEICTMVPSLPTVGVKSRIYGL
jgi:hypothetical protein